MPRYTAHLRNTDAELSLWKKKQRLRGIYKQWKVGLLQWEDISDDDKMLLEKYYGAGQP